MEQHIISWVNYDNKLKEYNEKCKLIRQEKEKLSESILNSIDLTIDKKKLPIYQISELNVSITPSKIKSYEGYTNKYLSECFTEYFKSGEEAEKLLSFLKHKRKVEEKCVLKRDEINKILA